MREGMNPNRLASVDGYKPYVAASIVHLPHGGGYHKDRLNVVKCSLETMRRNAGLDCQIYVWDNGSCDSFRDWLINEYKPDFLTLSPNVGKSIARASIVRSMPDNIIIGVSDDDMFFYPDWFKKQLEILQHFPDVGLVSGWPVRTQFRFAAKTARAWGESHNAITYGKWITPQEDKDFCTSIGRDYRWHLDNSRNDVEWKLNWRGKEAYGTGHHCQWIGNAEKIGRFVEYTHQAMAQERIFENAIDNAGLLRLTTIERTTRHIGNVLDHELEVLWRKKE